VTRQENSISSVLRNNIRQLDLFTDLLDEEINILVKHAKIHSLDQGEMLFQEGDEGDFFAIVIEGQIDITKHTENEKPIAMASLTNGATIGEMALIDRETRLAIAVEPSTIFVLSRQSFDTLIDQSPQCGVKLIRKIATNLCTTLSRTSNLFADSIEPGQ